MTFDLFYFFTRTVFFLTIYTNNSYTCVRLYLFVKIEIQTRMHMYISLYLKLKEC